MPGALLPAGAGRRLAVAFLVLLVLPAAAVVWLGVQYVVQDRQLEAEQLRIRRETAADRIVTELTSRLAEAEAELGTQHVPADDGVRVVIRASGDIDVVPARRLLYRPGSEIDLFATFPELTAGEDLEQRNDLHAAEAIYRRLASDVRPAIRAGALLRLARVLRRQDRVREALRVYDDLAHVTDVRIDGVPADLAARRARCVVLASAGDVARLREEAATLRSDLLGGRWAIDRGTFEQYAIVEVARWLGSETVIAAVDVAVAEAIARLWVHRDTPLRHVIRPSEIGWTLSETDAGQATETGWLLLSKLVGDETYALLVVPALQARMWREVLEPRPSEAGVRAELVAAEGSLARPGSRGRDEPGVRRPAAESGLPWDVVVRSDDTVPGGAARRRLVLAGLGFLVVLVIGGGSLVSRAVSRELTAAQLQSDFVASVSHEFRTPLTSLRQFTDLLNDAEDLPPEKRRQFYAAQSRATERLQRLVESLLDFRRMEAGTQAYRRAPIPAAPFIRGVVEDFTPEAASRGFQIDERLALDAEAIVGDAEALSLALWNLLDNAVKYSAGSRHVEVCAARQNGSLLIGVRDEGIGVPRDEHREIFRKFVRGRDARVRAIKGTGIGLAMVQHIVQAHGGRVMLESTPGEGSTFTIVLPCDRVN